MNPHWHTIITQSPQFTLGFTLGVVHSTGLDECMMTCVHHYRNIQSSFTALKTLCASPIHPSLPKPWHSLIFLLSPKFRLLQNVIELESYSIYPFQIGFFHLVICICFLDAFSLLDNSFLFRAEWYSIVWTYHSLFIHSPTEGCLSCFQVFAIMNKAAIKTHEQVFVWTCFQLLWININKCVCWIIW